MINMRKQDDKLGQFARAARLAQIQANAAESKYKAARTASRAAKHAYKLAKKTTKKAKRAARKAGKEAERARKELELLRRECARAEKRRQAKAPARSPRKITARVELPAVRNPEQPKPAISLSDAAALVPADTLVNN